MSCEDIFFHTSRESYRIPAISDGTGRKEGKRRKREDEEKPSRIIWRRGREKT